MKTSPFKWLTLLVAILYLAVFWQNSQNSRYVFSPEGVSNPAVVIDSRTGEVRMGSANLKRLE